MKPVWLFLSLLIGNVLGTGKLCRDVAPGIRPRGDQCPYQIMVDQVQIELDGIVIIYLNAESGVKGFRDILLMAFEVGRYKTPIGQFYAASANIKVIDCPGLTGGGVMQKSGFILNAMAKSFESVRWKPPQGFLGDVIFRATFVQSNKVYWINQEPLVPTTITRLSFTAKHSASAALSCDIFYVAVLATLAHFLLLFT